TRRCAGRNRTGSGQWPLLFAGIRHWRALFQLWLRPARRGAREYRRQGSRGSPQAIPLGLKDTVFNLHEDDEPRIFQGAQFRRKADAAGADANEYRMLWWALHPCQRYRALDEHLDHSAIAGDRALRLLDHAAYLYRDGLTSAIGLGDAGTMDAMGLGWV